ncbi:tetratricopeptide repeat protein [Micromonospora sp. NPDC047707]|uniref:tetratricopeptide repeat protein n=1 Tax=Micromonospora sp. NPDC047707 TaxID=3154498 RepID=UPI0034528BC5
MSEPEASGDRVALERAVTLLTTLVAATPAGHHDHARYLSCLGSALHLRFQLGGADPDLDEAIRLARQAVAATPAELVARAAMLSNLGNALLDRFGRTGVVADLDEAVDVGRRAAAASIGDHHHVVCLSNLGGALLTRFGHTGSIADLDEAIGIARQAVATTPTHHPDHPRRLANLGSALRTRSERTGSVPDLDEAIDVARQAVATTPAHHPDYAGRLANLSRTLRVRFERDAGTDADLDAAIRFAWEAVTATPAHHPKRATRLYHLGGALLARFHRTGAAADLDEAIGLLQTRFEHTRCLSDLNEAVVVGRKAVTDTPTDHPSHALFLSNLSTALHLRFQHSGATADVVDAMRGWELASRSPVAPMRVRLNTAGHRAQLLAAQRSPAAAVEAYAAAVELLPLLAWRGLSQREQQDLLRLNAGSLPRDGAGCAIAARLPDRTVELLECGRGTYWSQLLDTRTDLTSLRQVAPDLAARLHRCSVALEQHARTDVVG